MMAPSGFADKLFAGRYRITREIGRGGMATVYLADDLAHDRPVAIKVLLPELSSALGGERFAREIRVVARLQHPHILPLYDSGDADGVVFFVMPFIEGASLRDRLTRDGPMPAATVVRIVRQLADALDYAHTRGIVHRDVKPENILLTEGQALLADFGIARAAARTVIEAAGLTVPGVSLGTPAYMSPEQAAGEIDLDGRSDQYSLACVCYEMLSGSPPFVAATAIALIGQHMTKTPAPVTGAREPVNEHIVASLAHALAKDPFDRFNSVGAFARSLETALAEGHVPSRQNQRLSAREDAGSRRKTVCVLDFTNISAAPDVDWLSTGIAETVTVDLKKIGGIRVVGTDPATRKRLGSAASVDAHSALELGRIAGARWVVWGGFQKSGSRVRLTPQFGDTETGETISADKIDGDIDNVFALQDRIVTGLAGLLEIKLTDAEVAEIERTETNQLAAYEHYAKGQRAFRLFGKESARAATEHFRAAIAIDPGYALAWGGLGSLLMPKFIAYGRREDLDEGVAALQRAMQLDPALSEPYAFLAYMYMRQLRHADAIAAAHEAIEREPANFMGWYLLGIATAIQGLSEGAPSGLGMAVAPLLRCMTLGPAYHPALMVLGALYQLRGQYGHASVVIGQAVAIERSGTGLLFLGAHLQQAALHMNSGEEARARELVEWALSTYPTQDHVYAETMTAYGHFLRGALEERRGDLVEAASAFTEVIALGEANDHRLAIGHQVVKARMGLARVRFRAGDLAASTEQLNEGRRLITERDRYTWGWIMGSSEAETQYEIAAAHATRGELDEALAHLRVAVQAGWADLPQLHHDPAFTEMKKRPDVRHLADEAAAAVVLPPPVGNGGLPEQLVE